MPQPPGVSAVEREFIDRLIKSPTWQKVVDEVQRVVMTQLTSALIQPAMISNEAAMNLAAHLGSIDLRLDAVAANALYSALPELPTLVDSDFLDSVSKTFTRVTERRLAEANWWLPDHIDPAKPAWIRGLDEAFPAAERRRSIDAIIHALWQLRALLYYRHRRVPDSPGRLVVARRRIPRGPNFRRLTSICQPAGLLVRA